MSPFLPAAAITAAIALIAIYIFAPAKYRPALKPFLNRYYAHRGLFESGGAPENSLAAFKAAREAGLGVELDVRLTADGKLIVFHDATTGRMCKENTAVSRASYARLSLLHLNGTQEKIPLLSEALEVLGGVPLICEIKYDDVRDIEKVCKKTAKALKDYKGKYCIESFSPFAVRWFKKHEPKVVRGQISGALKNNECQNRFAAFLMRHLAINFIGRPDFIAYDLRDMRSPGFKLVRLMGASLFAWTVRSEEELQEAKKKFESYIIEGFIPKLKRL